MLNPPPLVFRADFTADGDTTARATCSRDG